MPRSRAPGSSSHPGVPRGDATLLHRSAACSDSSRDLYHTGVQTVSLGWSQPPLGRPEMPTDPDPVQARLSELRRRIDVNRERARELTEWARHLVQDAEERWRQGKADRVRTRGPGSFPAPLAIWRACCGRVVRQLP